MLGLTPSIAVAKISSALGLGAVSPFIGERANLGGSQSLPESEELYVA